jgi:hypothetical protein
MISDNVEFLENFENAEFSGTTGQNFMKHGGVIDICF